MRDLEKRDVGSLPCMNHRIVLDSIMTPKQVIKVLIDTKQRAAPVWNSKHQEFQCVLDLRDAVRLAITGYRQTRTRKQSTLSDEELSSFEEDQSLQGSNHSLVDCLDRQRPFPTILITDNLLLLTRLFATGAYIVGVFSTEGDYLYTLEQSELFSLISKLWNFGNDDRSFDCKLQFVADLGCVSMPVKTVRHCESALSAFDVMTENNLSGLAVVTEDGEIGYNMSSTDIRLWLHAKHSLEVNVEDFLIGIRRLTTTKKTPANLMVCTLGMTLKRIVMKLKATKWKRIWVIDEQRAPIGVISMTDLFRFILLDEFDELNTDEKEEIEVIEVEEKENDESEEFATRSMDADKESSSSLELNLYPMDLSYNI